MRPSAPTLCLAVLLGLAAPVAAGRMARYNVVWNSPSVDASGQMPLGNGDVAAGVYALQDGDLYVLLAKNDAYNYNGDLFKTGRVRVSLRPNPFAAGKPFRQVLDLETGSVRIEADGVTLRVWADAHRPVVHVQVDAPRTLEVTAASDLWERIDGCRWNKTSEPIDPPTQDVRLERGGHILWYFAVGDRSVYPGELDFYGVPEMAATFPDPYRHNTFGNLLESSDLTLRDGALRGAGRHVDLRIHALTRRAPDPNDWVAAIEAQAARPRDTERDWQAHVRWWRGFWERGWIVASDNRLPAGQREVLDGEGYRNTRDDPDGAALVAQSYNVFRYLMACQSRGRVQTKFNGGLFTQPLRYAKKPRLAAVQRDDGTWISHPDDRLWGRRFTYQNQRLLYWPLLASGDTDLMRPFFAYYRDLLPVRQAITRAWFGHGGAYYRENIEPTGGERDCAKGGPNDPEYKPLKTPPGQNDGKGYYHSYYFTSGLETTAMMLAYLRHTGDPTFRDEVLVPFARAVLRFFDEHYPREDDGTLRIDPDMVLETWWIAVNGAPDVAGLHHCLNELLDLQVGTDADRAAWRRLRAHLPPVPLQTIEGRQALAPAETWALRRNSENGELYPVFPFTLYGLGRGTADLVDWTLRHRTNPDRFGNKCWTQDQIHWAYAGNAAEARDGLLRRFRWASPLCRFPLYGSEGPDSCPDFDHFGSGSVALQRMLVQEVGSRIHLLPAWPADWDADFKLHLTGGAVVTGRVQDGRLVTWDVTPASRRSDVTVYRPQRDGTGPRAIGRDRLSSTTPARRWEEASVAGNGNLGVLVYGRARDETVTVTQCELFLPLGNREIVEPLAEHMPTFKAAGLAAGRDGPAEVHRLMQARHSQKIVPTDPLHPAFDLSLRMAGGQGAVRDLERTQNLANGQVTVRWRDDAGPWQRRCVVSRPDDLVALQIDGPPGRVGLSLSLTIKHELVRPTITVADGRIAAHTVYLKGKGGYDSLVRVVPRGGRMRAVGGTLRVEGADAVLLLMAVRPFKTPLDSAQSQAWAYQAENPDFGPGHVTNHLPALQRDLEVVGADYESLLSRHAAAHGALYDRVSLDLRADPKDRARSSEALVARALADGTVPAALYERMVDACRSLIISSTGRRPPNLQGLWTGTWKPAWSGDFTLDSNLELAIQSLLTCDLADLMPGTFDLVESWLPDCRTNARTFYGCRGVVSNARASNTCLLLHWDPWPGEQCTGCLGWLAHFFYDTYRFTGDRVLLAERVAPLLEEVAVFYEDLLAGTEDAEGHVRFFISYSPEHRLYANSTFDIAIAKSVLRNLVEAGGVLGWEPARIARWQTLLDKMPPYRINDAGELQEWAWPGASEDYNQRHHSHLLPLYQFCEFDRDRTPTLWRAANRAFLQKVTHWLHNETNANSSHITHGMADAAQCAARLGRGDLVQEVLDRFVLRRYLHPSFMMSYWPDLKGFGSDPVGTLPDVVNNSLIFAWEGTVDLLPALPPAWPVGTLRGVRARGRLHVEELTWDRPGGALWLRLTSGVAQTLTLRLPEGWRLTAAEASAPARLTRAQDGPDRCRLEVPADRAVSVHLTFSPTP